MFSMNRSQPRSFYILCFGELCERFSYYGTQSILVLFLTTVLLFSDDHSYTLYGVYTTLAFGMPLLGGILADRWLGQRRAILAGSVLLIIGNLLLVIPDLRTFCLGLAISLMGIGLYKPNGTSLVGQLYKKEDSRRSSGFTLFYMYINIGATVGSIIYGLAAQTWGWRYGFLLSAISIALSLIVFLKNSQHFAGIGQSPELKRSHQLLIYLLIGVGCVLIGLLFYYPSIANYCIAALGVAMLLLFLRMLMTHLVFDRSRLLALLLLGLFGTCFFTGSLQVLSSVSLFINRHVNHTIGTWEIPTQFFTALYPLFVIVVAPVLMHIWSTLALRAKEPSVPTKFCVGLLLCGLGLGCFAWTASYASTDSTSLLPLMGIVIGNLCLSAGELCLIPAMLAAINQLAPINLQSTMIGAWFMLIAFGGYLSGLIARLSSESTILQSSVEGTQLYSHFFLTLSVSMLITTALLMISTPWIKRLMQ
jgi:POT family proton-dependent oligopeptide transporter